MSEPAPYRPASKNSLVPMHYQVQQDMRERITTGVWPAGQMLPGEMELCTLYGVSRTTMRQAISSLVDEGLIVRERGRGSFVRSSMVTAGTRGLTSFTGELATLGLKAGARLLSRQVIPATAELAQRLSVAVETPLIVLKRVRYANDSPIGIQVAHLPLTRFPDLEHVDLTDISLYSYLEERYHVIVAEAEEVFRTTLITGEDARILHVHDVQCGFAVERLTFDGSSEPFEFVTSILRGDRYQVQLFLRASKRPV
jgi:GntR family transcriptional regulator, N-acetylglucosamine utilization regulator